MLSSYVFQAQNPGRGDAAEEEGDDHEGDEASAAALAALHGRGHRVLLVRLPAEEVVDRRLDDRRVPGAAASTGRAVARSGTASIATVGGPTHSSEGRGTAAGGAAPADRAPRD